ncbi:MAG: hypothetical protein MJ095_03560 [Oscillospiraceae bacterium]|nr:hypothetical protein [Oscillospiraceae bacterium]
MANERYNVCEPYLISRIKALRMPPAVIGVKLTDDKQIYSAVVDIPMGRGVLGTLVCLANGTVNIFFNNGSQITGISAHNPALAQACRSFLASAGQSLPVCQRTSVFDLPMGSSEHFVHLMTRKGVYKTVINPATAVNEENKMRAFLLHLYQKVMNEVQTAQIREAARNK